MRHTRCVDTGTLINLALFLTLVAIAATALLIARRRARVRARERAELALDRLASRVCTALEEDPDVEQQRTQSLLSWYSELGDDLRRATTRGDYRQVAWSARAAEAADQAWEKGQRIPGAEHAERVIFGGARIAGGVAAAAWAAWREHGGDVRTELARSRARSRTGSR